MPIYRLKHGEVQNRSLFFFTSYFKDVARNGKRLNIERLSIVKY